MSSQSNTLTVPTGSDSITRCDCNEVVPLRTAGSGAKHPGRQFYSCAKDRGDPARCKFFVWKDEIDRALPATPHSSQMQPPASSQPMPSQRQRAIMARGLSAPTPQKRHRSPSESGRRKENIELALSQGGESAQKPQTSASYTDELPQFDTGDDSGDEYFTTTSSPPRRTLSFQLDTQEPPCKKLRTDNDGFESGSGGYMFMTPPMSDGNILRIGITSSQPESPTRGRGKGKDMSQWEKIHADENHPCHQHTASLRSESSQTAASNSASVSNMTPDSIKTLLSGMSTILPAYIAKLERKQVAMEKSDSFKVQKIRCLEEEISSLHNRIRVLEETVSALKARRPPS